MVTKNKPRTVKNESQVRPMNENTTIIDLAKEAGFTKEEIKPAFFQLAREAGFADDELTEIDDYINKVYAPSFGERALSFAGDVAGGIADFAKDIFSKDEEQQKPPAPQTADESGKPLPFTPMREGVELSFRQGGGGELLPYKVPMREGVELSFRQGDPIDMEPRISQGTPAKKDFTQRIFGIESKITPEGAAKATMELEAKREGVPISEYREPGPRLVEQFAEEFTNEMFLGLPHAIEKAQGDSHYTHASTAEDVSAKTGKLLGFIVGSPGRIAGITAKAFEKIAPGLALRAADSGLKIGAKLATKEAASLAAATASASLGEAMSQQSLDDALAVLARSFGSGAMMGATFGAARGAFPVERIKRIATGIALLDLQRGQNPFDERTLAEKGYDYGIDTFFLWRGLKAKDFDRLEEDILKALDESGPQKTESDFMRPDESEGPKKPEDSEGYDSTQAEKTQYRPNESESEITVTHRKDSSIQQGSLFREPHEMTRQEYRERSISAVKDYEHEDAVKQALLDGRLTPEKYALLHEKDYGPIAGLLPDAQKKIGMKPEESEPDPGDSKPPALPGAKGEETSMLALRGEAKKEERAETPGAGKETIVEPTPKEKNETTTLKDQKKYLIDKVDEAIKEAPDSVEAVYKTINNAEVIDIDKTPVVTIDVPGDGQFTIVNSREALRTFAKTVKSKFPSSDRSVSAGPPKLPTMKASGKRIETEDVQYYNEFKPRKQNIITRNDDKPNMYDPKMGMYSNGHYMIKAERPKDVKNIVDYDMKSMKPNLAGEGYEKAEIVGEFNSGMQGERAKAHVVGENGAEAVIEARYADVILSMYPDAKVKVRDEEKPVLFESDGEPVGLISPMRFYMDDLRGEGAFGGRVDEVIKDRQTVAEAAEAEARMRRPPRSEASRTRARTKEKEDAYSPEDNFDILDIQDKSEQLKEIGKRFPQFSTTERAKFRKKLEEAFTGSKGEAFKGQKTEAPKNWQEHKARSDKQKKKGADAKKKRKTSKSKADEGGYADRESTSRRSASTHADEGGYAERRERSESPKEDLTDYVNRHRVIVEMPELVEMARELLGRHPKIVKNLRLHMGRALGAFYHDAKKGKIVLKASIFKDSSVAVRVLAHEIGHLVDWIPDKDLRRGNILGRIASLKRYMEDYLEEYPDSQHSRLTKEDIDRFKAEAAHQVKEEAAKGDQEIIEEIIREEPIYEEIGITPDMIKEIMTGMEGRDKYPELYEFIAKLSSEQKKTIVKHALKGLVHDLLAQATGRKVVGTRTVKETRTILKKASATQKDIKARFEEILREEIVKRRLYERKVIDEELRNLTQEWKPFDTAQDRNYTKYRYSSSELYADAFSVLMNDPALLKEIAPTFNKAFFSYIERKPEVKAIYDSIQEKSREEIIAGRRESVRSMFDEGQTKRREAEEAHDSKTGKSFFGALYEGLVDQNYEALRRYKQAKAAGKKFSPEEDPRYWIEELPYIAGEIHAHHTNVNAKVVEPAKAKGISIDDIGEYMLYKRIVEERGEMIYGVDETGKPVRGEIANPLGLTKDAATELLAAMKKKMGEEKFKALEGYAKDFWGLRQKNVIPLLKKADMYSDALMEKIENNQYYATFDVLGYLSKRYGKGIAAHIHKQIGTFEHIDNPFVATLMKDAALIRAANVTMAKRSMVAFLKGDFKKDIREAERRWNGKYRAPIEPTEDGLGMLAYLEGGKVKAFYVPKDIAENFNRRPYEANKLLKVWQSLNVPLRNVLVAKNPLWMAFNTIRDFIGTVKNLPGLSAPKLIKYYALAFKHAFNDSYRGKSSEVVSQMLRDKMIVLDRQFTSIDMDAESELAGRLNAIGHNPVRRRNLLIRPIVGLWNLLGETGKFTERIAKIAGYMYLSKETNLSRKEIAHLVRSRVGTPDIYRRGKWNVITNNLFLFSNVGKEGWRASWESANESPATYIWKTIKFNLVPKFFFFAALNGWMGQGVQNVAQGVSNYDKENYLCIPLGLSELNKSIYLRLPQDYTGQVIGGLFWNLMNMDFSGRGSVLDYGSSQTPYSFNPYLTAFFELGAYYLAGLNPPDMFRGGNAIPDKVFEAGGSDANIAMAKRIWNEMGGNVVYKFKTDDIDKIRSGFEEALNLPVGNVLGRFLKISSYGKKEMLKEETEGIRQEEARRLLAVKKRIIKAVDDADGKPSVADLRRAYIGLKKENLIDDGMTVTQFRHMFNRYASRAPENPYIDAIVQARTSKEKAALLRHYKDTLPAHEYSNIRKQLFREGHITIGTLTEARKLAERSK